MRLVIQWLAILVGGLLATAPAGASRDFERHGGRGVVVLGKLRPGRVTRHPIRLHAGELLTAAVLDPAGGELHDPLLGVFAPTAAGGPAAADDDGGPGFLPRLTLLAEESGVFTLVVTGFGDGDFDGSGHAERLRYRLVVAIEADPPRLIEREAAKRGAGVDALRLRRGATLLSGRLTPGDLDAFELSLKPGATLTVSVFESGRGEFHDPVLRLYDERRRLLAQNDDGGPGFLANLSFSAPRVGRGQRPVALRLELDGFDADGAGGTAHREDFPYQLVISIDHFSEL